jgi:hypothetical protein
VKGVHGEEGQEGREEGKGEEVTIALNEGEGSPLLPVS